MNHFFNTQMILLIAAVITLLNRPAIAAVLNKRGLENNGNYNGGMPTSVSSGMSQGPQSSASIPRDTSLSFAKNSNSIQTTEEGSLDLTSKNYNLVSKGTWKVYYFLPNCQPCKDFQSIWNQQAQNNQEKGIRYAKVNCEAYPDLCRDVKRFPSLFEFNNGKKKSIDIEKYKRGLQKNKLVP